MMLPDKSQRITKVSEICHEGNVTVYSKCLCASDDLRPLVKSIILYLPSSHHTVSIYSYLLLLLRSVWK